MADLKGFNAHQIQRRCNTPLPKDDYLVKVVRTSKHPNAENNGAYLEVKLIVLAGEYEGYSVLNRLNIENPDKNTVQKSLAMLAKLAIACGVPETEKSSDFIGIPIIASCEPYGNYTKVTDYRPAQFEHFKSDGTRY